MFPLRELAPLITTLLEPLAPIADPVIITPATLPCKALIAFVEGFALIASPSTCVIEYPTALVFLFTPSAVTTTSDNALSGCRETLTVAEDPTTTDCEVYPTKLKTRVSPLEASIE